MKKVTLPVTSIVLAAIVFGFLCYCQPWLMTAREQSQLWLCSIDYLGILVRTRWISTLYRGVFRTILLLYPLGSYHNSLISPDLHMVMVVRGKPHMELLSRSQMSAMAAFRSTHSTGRAMVDVAGHQCPDDTARGGMPDPLVVICHTTRENNHLSPHHSPHHSRLVVGRSCMYPAPPICPLVTCSPSATSLRQRNIANGGGDHLAYRFHAPLCTIF